MWVCMLNQFHNVQLLVTLRTVARQAPLSLGFSRQEYWSNYWLLLEGAAMFYQNYSGKAKKDE